MKKIVSVIGARPQFIKHAPVSIALKRRFNSKSIHTGQHFDDNMSKIFFDELKITHPDYILHLDNATLHGVQTAKMLQEVEKILIAEKPDAVLVYGDTNSTLAGALAASKLNIPILHVEAGLRSFNREMPEEINRVLTDHLSTLLFAPSPIAVANLKNEGIEKGVFAVGDVMKDSLDMIKPYLEKKEKEPYFFVTIHRPYNTDDKDRILDVFNVLNRLGKRIVFSIHPRTTRNINKWGIKLNQFQNITFIEPVGYRDSISYQFYSDCILTDSGGIQKEAYFLEKRCITIRKETEWSETLTYKWNQLVFDDLNRIPDLLNEIPGQYIPDIYGDGRAAEKIVNIIYENIH